PATAAPWAGIENTSEEFDSIGVELSHITIEYAETGINYGKGFAYRTISNAVFQNNDRGVFDGAWGYTWITVNDSEFLNNDQALVGRTQANNCLFENNTYGMGDPYSFQNSSAGGRAINCTFNNNDFAIAFISNPTSFIQIENSQFSGNGRDVYTSTANSYLSTYTGATVASFFAQKGEVKNNTWADNVLGVEISLFPWELSVIENTFTNNSVGIQVSGTGALIENNIFCGNTDYDAVVATAQAVNISNNCWCVADPGDLPDRIYDAFDDVSVGIATFVPFTTDCLGSNAVFPGDANNDGTANVFDLLPLGVAWGTSGPARTGASTDWTEQSLEPWPNTLANGLNPGHIDANGDGMIDQTDLSVLQTNLGLTHSEAGNYPTVTFPGTAPEAWLEGPGSVNAGQLVTVDIYLGNVTTALSDLYATGLKINYNSELIQAGSWDFDAADGWLGEINEDVVQLQEELDEEGAFELALTRLDQEGVNGSGKLGTLSFIVIEDLMVLGAQPNENQGSAGVQELVLEIAAMTAINPEGIEFDLITKGYTLDLINSAFDLPALSSKIQVVPNPAMDQVELLMDGILLERVELFDARGQIIRQETTSNELSVADLPAGNYQLRIITDRGIIFKPLIVLR
ncbi:MAG: T9SS type A sorting domain-containing protein, partial [Bacteroidota bacterium]